MIAGVTWHARPGLEVALTARWLWLHLQDRIDIRLDQPGAGGAPACPTTSSCTGASTTCWTPAPASPTGGTSTCASGAELRVETSAVDASDVNAAAVDGLKVEPVILAELRVRRRFWLTAGYGLTHHAAGDGHRLRLPSAGRVHRAPSRGRSGHAACKSRAAGTARPTAAGTYTRLHAGLRAHPQHEVLMVNHASTAAFSAFLLLGVRRQRPGAGAAPPAPGGRRRTTPSARPSRQGSPAARSWRARRSGRCRVSKWRLDNGLEIILLPDPHATAVSYMTWFRVGSRNEDAAAGETGLAHLFEHLMFTQTKNQPAQRLRHRRWRRWAAARTP